MDLSLVKISEEEFNRLNYPILFTIPNNSRSFGILKNDAIYFRLAWQSDIVNPIISRIDTEIYSVGIDRHFVIINIMLNNVLFQMNFSNFFIDSKVINGYLYIITEMKVIKVDLAKYNVINEYDLPDIYYDSEVRNNILKVSCFGNNNIEIRI